MCSSVLYENIRNFTGNYFGSKKEFQIRSKILTLKNNDIDKFLKFKRKDPKSYLECLFNHLLHIFLFRGHNIVTITVFFVYFL